LPITKSESVAVGLWEERVSAMKLEKQPPRPRALRFTPSSRNSPGKAPLLGVLLLLVKDQGSVMVEPFTMANVEFGGGGTGTRGRLGSLGVQRKPLMVETEPPTVKSLTRRMSPSACVPVKGWPPFWVTLEFSPTGFWRNQKPAVASPLLSKRSRPQYRITSWV